MGEEVKGGRRYRSPLRAEQARRTRQLVLDTARAQFLDRGYAATTIAGIATAAGVSPDTIYSALGGKRGLLEALAEAAILGPESPTPLEEQSWWDEIAALPDARQRLRRWVHHSCRALARTSPVHAIIRGAADGDSVAAELRRRLFRERLASQSARARLYLAGALREGVSLEEAGERYCAMTSPELHHLLTDDLGWTLEAHERWVRQVLESDLLPETPQASDGPP